MVSSFYASTHAESVGKCIKTCYMQMRSSGAWDKQRAVGQMLHLSNNNHNNNTNYNNNCANRNRNNMHIAWPTAAAATDATDAAVSRLLSPVACKSELLLLHSQLSLPTFSPSPLSLLAAA